MKSEDIARLAGVSRGTVSRVLNGKTDVAEATRKKIEKIIEDHGYTPNVSARKLAGKPVEVLGFFVCNISQHKESDDYTIKWVSHESPYFVRIMVSLLSSAKNRGYNILVDIINSVEDLNDVESYFKSGMISGAIFMGFNENEPVIDNYIKKGYKLTLIDQKEQNDFNRNTILVNADDEDGAYLATNYLISKGHRKIAHVHGSKQIVSGRLRINGYLKALKDKGIEIKESYIGDGNYDEKISYNATKKIIEDNKNDIPTAIFFGNDVMAVGGIRAIKELGLKPKRDISIIGYDNYSFGDIFDMGFTSLKAPLEKMSDFATDNLIKFIKNEEHEKAFKGKVEIIERDSVRDLNSDN